MTSTSQPQSISNTLRCSVISELDTPTNVASFPVAKTPLSPQPHTCSNLSVASSSINFPTDERRETISTFDLLSLLGQVSLDNSFAVNGYKKLNKICNILQGELYKAQNIISGQYVAIKKVDKSLANQQIAIQQIAIQDETKFCVSENVVKEGEILKYLTVNNTSIGRHIVRYIDFFSDKSSYFLVMEYIESTINLKQFVSIAHQYIASGKLRRKHYKQAMKYIFWQIAITLYWMHNDMSCCHLDLHTDNILLQNCSFQQYKDGYIRINPSISVKLSDFGVAELFSNMNGFECNKTGLSIDNAQYLAPNVYAEEMYDARCADMWSLGMIIFECLTGEPLYSPMDISPTLNGYGALHDGNLKKYISQQIELKHLAVDSLNLLLHLLKTDEHKRYKAINVLQHKWFTMYFTKYWKQIARKTVTQKIKLLKQKKSTNFDYYELNT